MKPELKVCDITNEADALGAAQLGVQYLGYILNYTASPRFVMPQIAKIIIQRVKQLYPTVQHVGVLVQPTDQLIMEVEQLGLDVLQIYGAIPNAVTKPVWQSDIGTISKPRHQQVTMQHCDASYGSGTALATALLTTLKPILPLVIAGGINADNLAQVIAACSPAIIDVNSGVESAPGKKDLQKIYELQQLIF